MCTKLSISQRNWIVRGICLVPLIMSISSMALGIWLCTVIFHNTRQSTEQQIHYEKVLAWNDGVAKNGIILHLDNESPFSYIPLDNLFLYMSILGFVAIFGGFARLLATTLFCNHYCRNRLASHLYWSWLILCFLSVTIETLVAFDVLLTLSHNNVSPPYNRDFFFTNDTRGLYWLCHAFRIFIWLDLALLLVTQAAIYVIYYKFKDEIQH